MSVAENLVEGGVVDLAGTTRGAVLREMVRVIAGSERIPDPRAFYRALLEREKLVSTGIGFGIAIPHAKVPGIRGFCVALGRSKVGVVYPSLDDRPVHIVVMIAGPDGRQASYLKLLAAVQRFLKNECEAILAAGGPEEVRRILASY